MCSALKTRIDRRYQTIKTRRNIRTVRNWGKLIEIPSQEAKTFVLGCFEIATIAFFTPSQIDRLLQVHKLKGQGYPYEKISEHFNTQPEHNLNNPPSTLDYNSINASTTTGRDLELKIQQIENHHRKLHEINKILIKNNKHFDNIIKEQNAKIESLEERVALLVDLHTENLLKRGLSFTEKFNNIIEEGG